MSDGARRILAVDFGDRRTGLAATDPTGTIIVPLPHLEGLDDQACAEAIAAVVAERASEQVVVGVPLLADGSAGARADRTMVFVERLQEVLSCPVHTVDESHTTDEAHARLKAGQMKAARRKKVADSVAAIVILERFRASGPS